MKRSGSPQKKEDGYSIQDPYMGSIILGSGGVVGRTGLNMKRINDLL